MAVGKLIEINVLTLNIHKGFSSGNMKFTLERIRKMLRQSEADIVFLQEVVGENSRHEHSINAWPKQNQFEFLADSVWSHFAYGKNAIYQHGHHGNAILSETPFSTSKNIDLSLLKFSQRGVVHGILDNGIHVLCAHLGLFEFERRKQVSKLVRHIQETIPEDAALILAGDFNDWTKRTHKTLSEQLGLKEVHACINQNLAVTYPSAHPFLPMDRIYTRGFTIKNAKTLKVEDWKSLTDHIPLQASIERNIVDE